MTELDESLALHPTAPGEWSALSDPRHEANNGMFGGWTAALLLKAVLSDARAGAASASALTVNFIGRLPAGRNVSVSAGPVGGGRSLSFWTAQMKLEGESDLVAQASVVLAHRRTTDAFAVLAPPPAPAPEDSTILPMRPPGPHGQRLDMRGLLGFPPFDRPDARSTAWVRETSGRPMDAIQLAFLADAYPPRIFYAGTAPRLSSTITYSVYFHATPAELEDVGDDFVLTEAYGSRGESGTMGQQARLWSRAGKLLATTEQLHWYK